MVLRLLSISICVSVVLVADAQQPRFSASLISTNASLRAFLNNAGQVSYTDRTFTLPYETILRNADGSMIQCPVGPINDLGYVLNNVGGMNIYNSNTGVYAPLTLPAITGRWTGISLSNSNVALCEGTNFSAPVGGVWTSSTTPIVYPNSYASGGNSIGDTAIYVPSQGAGYVRRADGTQYRVNVPATDSSVDDLNDVGDVTVSAIGGQKFLLDSSNQILANPLALSGYGYSGRMFLNNRKEIVWGASPSPSSPAASNRAVYWNAVVGTVPLDTLATNLPSGKILGGALDINNRGEILAWAANANTDGFGQGELYLLRPVPEPASMIGLGVGLVALIRKRNKK